MKTIKKGSKMVLDAAIFILLMFMFRKNLISMSFHEIGGLALIALFVMHHFVNGQWIVSVTKRLFKAGTPTKSKIMYGIDALLLVCFLIIGISGAMISKVVFNFGVHGGVWKTLHYFCAALSVLLVGIHLGLHWNYLFRFAAVPGIRKTVFTVVVVLLCAFGAYSLATTSYTQWLTMPFSTANSMEERRSFEAGKGLQPDAANGETNLEIDSSAPANGQGQGQALGKGQGLHGNAGQGPAGNQGGIGSILLLIANYASIAALFAVAAHGAELLLMKRRRRMPEEA